MTLRLNFKLQFSNENSTEMHVDQYENSTEMHIEQLQIRTHLPSVILVFYQKLFSYFIFLPKKFCEHRLSTY